MNRWNIPAWLEIEATARDTHCVYCRISFSAMPFKRSSKPSWEHIINDARIITRENIVLCCIGCNASKGQKTLAAWLDSKYCKARGITAESIAPIARAALVAIAGRDA
jgi:hypothetical protein